MRSLLAILALILSTLSVDAKRGAKPNPKTATFGDVEFIASSEECGIVLVKRSTAPHKLEKQRIYRVRYNPFKERDVQDVWIADMFIAGDTLWIRDELNRIYSMTMKTFSVSERKDVSIDDLQKLKRKTAANKTLVPTHDASLVNRSFLGRADTERAFPSSCDSASELRGFARRRSHPPQEDHY